MPRVNVTPDPREPAPQPGQPPQPAVANPGGEPAPAELPTMPLQVAPPVAATPPPPEPAAPASNDLCPNCHARMAPDQRYCLSCGGRRGEPRLPFMDAVRFMDSMHAPPAAVAAAAAPPAPPKQRFSSGTTLIAGVATLILAIGVGVLIGQSGEDSAPAVAKQPQITVNTGGGGGAAEATEASGGANAGKGKGGGKKEGKEDSIETGSSGTSKGAEEFIKPDADVKLAPPTTGVGDDCEKGTAGCGDSGKFDGSFFGE